MTRLVVDASIAIKWVISEPGSEEAASLLSLSLLAPDLLIAECANVLWKKVKRGNLLPADAVDAALGLSTLDIELVPLQELLAAATALSIELEHPAYDCFYLALALREQCPFVTADQRFLERVGRSPHRDAIRRL